MGVDKMCIYVNRTVKSRKVKYKEIVEDLELFAKLGHWTFIWLELENHFKTFEKKIFKKKKK